MLFRSYHNMPINLSGSLVLTGSLTATSTITAQTLVVQTITSSISSITGSTNFGTLSSNIHTFTGSISVSGSGGFVGGITAISLGLNGSIANNADTATLNIKQSSTSYNNGIYLERGGERNGYHMYIGGSLDALTFRRNYFGTQSDVMSLTRVGNVGIGTSSPSQKFEVVGGEIKAGRVDSSNEGGQVSFGRASDNATGWYIDVYGNTSTPSLRFVDVSNSAVRMTLDSSGNVSVGSGTFTVSQGGATRAIQIAGNSNNQGAAYNYKVVRHFPVVSSGNKLIIPFVSQENLNSNTIVKIFGHSARYNARNPLAFSAYFAVGHLSVLSDLTAWGVNGNISSIGYGGGMNVEINFSSAYTSGEANGIFITIEYMTNVPPYSINVSGITMN